MGFAFWDCDSENAVGDLGFHAIHVGVVREAEAAQKLALGAFNSVPFIAFVHGFFASLTCDLQSVAIFH